MSLATFNGQPVLTCCVSLPAYGLWWADVECASDVVSTGVSSLVIDNLTLRGTIVTGGAYQTRTRYRLVGGAGGWGKSIPAKSYANDLGVKLATVLRDAASECGETLGTVDPSATVGPAFVRTAGPASRVLSELVPRGWYVDESGVTQIGRRPSVPFTGVAARMVNDAAQSRYELAPDAGTLSKLLPGAVVDGVEAVDVEHAIGDDGTLRTTLWGRGVADTSRMNEALRRIVESFTAGSRYFALWEYRIVQQAGDRLDLQIVRVSSGMPDLRSVPAFPATEYATAVAVPLLGSTCIVAFVNGDPSRPQLIARSGDPVLIGVPGILAATMVAGGNPVTATKGLVGRIGVGA